MCQGTQTLNVAQNLKPNDKTKLDFANGFNLDSQPSQSKRTYVHDFIIKDMSNGVFSLSAGFHPTVTAATWIFWFPSILKFGSHIAHHHMFEFHPMIKTENLMNICNPRTCNHASRHANSPRLHPRACYILFMIYCLKTIWQYMACDNTWLCSRVLGLLIWDLSRDIRPQSTPPKVQYIEEHAIPTEDTVSNVWGFWSLFKTWFRNGSARLMTPTQAAAKCDHMHMPCAFVFVQDSWSSNTWHHTDAGSEQEWDEQ